MHMRKRLKAAFELVAWDLTTAAAGACIGAVTGAAFSMSAPSMGILLAGTLIGAVSGAIGAAGVGRLASGVWRLATAWRRLLEKTTLGEESRDALSILVPATGSTLTAIFGTAALASTGIAPAGLFIFLGATAWGGAMWGTAFGVDRPERPSQDCVPPPPKDGCKLRQ